MVVYPDHIIESMYVLVSAFKNSYGDIIPVKLEVKKNVDGNKPLYVVVSHGDKIKRETVNPEAAADGMNDSNAIRPNESGSFTITIPQILSYVNSNFEGFVKYFPDEMLSVEVESTSNRNTLTFNSNQIVTAHGQALASEWLYNAIEKELNGNTSVFYINNKKATHLLKSAKRNLPGALVQLDGFVHSIHDTGSNINIPITDITESLQYPGLEDQNSSNYVLDSFGINEISDYIHVQRRVIDALNSEGFFSDSDGKTRTAVNKKAV